MSLHARLPLLTQICLCIALTSACAASSDSDDVLPPCHGKCDSLVDDRIDGDEMFAHMVQTLSNDLDKPLRHAIDRSINDLADLDTITFPTQGCNGVEHVFWNGEQWPLARLGMIGIANMVVLQSTSRHSAPPVVLLQNALGDDDDAMEALVILRRLESPALMLEAVSALIKNAEVSAPARRALVLYYVDLVETKRLRDSDGQLRLPDFDSPPSPPELVAALASSPLPSNRAFGVRVLISEDLPISTVLADQLLDDPHFSVKVDAAPLVWMSSNPQQRILDTLQWLTGPEGRMQMRLQLLGMTEEEAVNWADEPAGFGILFTETVAEFVGTALQHAPPTADIRPLLDTVQQISQITAIIEDAADAIFRSTDLSSAEKRERLIGMVDQASSMQWDYPTAFDHLWRELGGQLLEAPDAELSELLFATIYLPPEVDRAPIAALLASANADDRRAAFVQFAEIATWQNGIAAALFDAGFLDPLLLEKVGAFGLLAAADNGLPAEDLIQLVLDTARPINQEQVIRFYGADNGVRYLEVFSKALDSANLPAEDKVEAILKLAEMIDPGHTTIQLAPGPSSPDLSSAIYPILARLGELTDDSEAYAIAWTRALTRPDGKLRWHLLWLTPTDEYTRLLVASTVKPHLTFHPFQCDTEFAIHMGLVGYVVSPPRIGLDPQDIVNNRIDTLVQQSTGGDELSDSSTVETIFTSRPGTNWLYYGGQDSSLRQKRDLFEMNADDLADLILDEAELDPMVPMLEAMGAAADYDQLSATQFTAMIEHITEATANGPEWQRQHLPAYLFYLYATRGVGYDELASRLRDSVRLRWDLADQARPDGEQAALETLLVSVGREYGTSGTLLSVATRVAFRADISEASRKDLIQLGTDGWGYWSTGSLTLIRQYAASLDEAMLRGAAYRASQPSARLPLPTEMTGTATSDSRLSASAALRFAWTTMAVGSFREGDFYIPASITQAIDAVLGIWQRSDVSASEKRALGRALLYLLPAP